jgi:cyclopropane fatty-acyl-phospholipid synthase-like methyltransferase
MNSHPDNPPKSCLLQPVVDTGAPPSFRERWRALKLAHCAIPNYGSSRQFWGNKKKVHTVYTKGDGKHDEKTNARLAAMNIQNGSRVLDIGAGPGTYAIPLTKKGCKVTVIEPSPVMRELLETRMKKEKIKSITVIPKRWEDVDLKELGAPFDVVIASFSLTMMDMGEALAKMHASCRGTVHLFWFLTEPEWASVNRDLWPHLHGGIFPGEPTADWLWQILYEMGIYASIQPEHYGPRSHYTTVDEAVEEFRQRLNCTTPAHEEIVRNYFQTVLRHNGDGLTLGRGTRSAHIWWNTADQ